MAAPFRLLLLLVACLIGMSAASAQRRYSVDDMLATEAIGNVRFDPSGQRLFFERYGPFDRQSDYGRQFVPGETRSTIFAVDLAREAPPAPLFAQRSGEGHTIADLSPDGALMLITRVTDNGVASGAVPVAGGAPTMFDFSPVLRPAQALPWMGRRTILAAGHPGEIDTRAAIGNERLEALAALWAQRNRGERSTASRIGSGRLASLPAPEGGLVLADAGNPQVQMLAPGRFSTWHASADGSALATLREESLVPDPTRRVERGADSGVIQRRLLILEPRPGGNRRPREPCRGCDVLSTSLNWSATAPLLAFVARDTGSQWSAASYHVYDHRTGESRPVDLGSLRPHAVRSSSEADIRSAWIGERLAVFAAPPAAEEADPRSNARPDWHLVTGGPPRNLTADFAGNPPELVGIGRDCLVLIHGGDAWRIDADGNRRNLTADIAEPVASWREPGPFASLPVENRQPSETIVLRLASQRPDSPARLLFVDVETGRVDTVTAPSANAEFLAASAAARRAALAERVANVTTLMVIGADGSRRELARLNEHLRGVVGGTPVRIDHEGPGGDDRMSWILLPPDYRPGRPVPTVVNVYPGAVGRQAWTRWEMDRAHALNDHILAAQGYAVLYPSLPVRNEQVPRDPLNGLTDQVFAAVGAAISRGYVDPDRMAVQGHSLGGFAAGALIGQTNRFRSAIAQAGLFDLISGYGQFDVRRRLDIERTGLDLFAANLIESSQVGMGAPPWEDPQRYLRNSPLMHVRNVNTPIMLITGDLDYVSTTQTEEFFTALTRLDKDAVMVRYFGEDHVFNSPANIRDMWRRILEWYDLTLRSPTGQARRARALATTQSQ